MLLLLLLLQLLLLLLLLLSLLLLVKKTLLSFVLELLLLLLLMLLLKMKPLLPVTPQLLLQQLLFTTLSVLQLLSQYFIRKPSGGCGTATTAASATTSDVGKQRLQRPVARSLCSCPQQQPRRLDFYVVVTRSPATPARHAVAASTPFAPLGNNNHSSPPLHVRVAITRTTQAGPLCPPPHEHDNGGNEDRHGNVRANDSPCDGTFAG